MRKESLLKIKGVGKKYAAVIASWQKEAHFSTDVDLVSSMIIEDAKRILALMEAIATIEQELEPLCEQLCSWGSGLDSWILGLLLPFFVIFNPSLIF
jgi:hypothetical protein